MDVGNIPRYVTRPGSSGVEMVAMGWCRCPDLSWTRAQAVLLNYSGSAFAVSPALVNQARN